MIEVSPDQDDVVRRARQSANHIGRLLALDGLFPELLRLATRLAEQLLQFGLAVEIGAFVSAQPFLDYLLFQQLEVNLRVRRERDRSGSKRRHSEEAMPKSSHGIGNCSLPCVSHAQ